MQLFFITEKIKLRYQRFVIGIPNQVVSVKTMFFQKMTNNRETVNFKISLMHLER